MLTINELKKKWFLDFNKSNNPLCRRPPDSELSNWTDGNEVEIIIDGKALMEHFYNCIQKMIGFMGLNKNTQNPPQIWISNMDITNIELLGPGKGGDIFELLIRAAKIGVKVYLLHSGQIYQYLGYFGKLLQPKMKGFLKKLNLQPSGFGASDSRTPSIWGVQHQKFYICLWPEPTEWIAVVSSADFNHERWDTPNHFGVDNLTHELSAVLRGPVVRDIAITFAERWNDRSSIKRTDPIITATIPTELLYIPIPARKYGTHSIQVLRTYPILRKNNYSWSKHGEFSVWGSYLQAIQQAKQYIYIEDQYLSSFILPPIVDAPKELLNNLDVIYQLGRALERKVDIVILVTGKHDDKWAFRKTVKQQKAASINYLYDVYQHSISKSKECGRLVIRTLVVENKNVLVHSKLMIVDDEFVLMGNANIGPRSMTYDSEIQLGIVDEKGSFAQSLRIASWMEHLQFARWKSTQANQSIPIDKLKDPGKAISMFINNEVEEVQRLQLVRPNIKVTQYIHPLTRCLMKTFTQPYAGPGMNEFL